MVKLNRIILSFAALVSCISVYSQQNFEERLVEIRRELDQKSDSSIVELNELVTFDISSAPIQEFIGLLATTHDLNVSVDPNIAVIVSNRFSKALVKDVFFFLCQTYELDINFINNIISFKKFAPPILSAGPYAEKILGIEYNPTTKKVNLSLEQDSLRLFTKQFTNKTGVNVIYSPELKDIRVNSFLRNTEPQIALEQLALANNLLLDKTGDSFYVFVKPGANEQTNQRSVRVSRGNSNEGDLEITIETIGSDQFVTVSAVNVPILEVIGRVTEEMSKQYFMFTEPEGNISMNVQGMLFDDFFHYLFQATDHTFKVNDGVYVVGRRDLEGLRSAKILKLKYRSVEEIDTFIPQELKDGVSISIFKELNALILSGGSPQIREIEIFLKGLDEPVPNIMIEVIVVDVRQGYNIQTGIQAFLTDSANAPQTTGRVFPGVDVTLGTGAINNVLDRAGGAINIGRVTPRFYATLKAMEDNNNINIRSTPKLATLNGHEATLTIGQSVFFVQQTQNINSGVNPITTISQQFRQVEANLSILINPIVSGNEHVTLSIDAEFSSFTPPEFENAPPGNATRRFTSKIRVENQEMIMLGGLEEVSSSETSSGVPLLSRIPVLKWFFSSKGKEKDNDKLVVFIKPSIIF